jgi:hypothetical protein
MINVELTKDDILSHVENQIIEALQSYSYQDEDGECRGNVHKFKPAADAIIDRISDDISKKLWEEEKKMLQSKIEVTIAGELSKILNTAYQPVNHWGDKDGEVTTIKELFLNTSKDYWLQKVDINGKPIKSGYYNTGVTRAEYVCKSQLESAFKDVLYTDIASVVNAFKDGLKQTLEVKAKEQIGDALGQLIKAR